MKKTLVFLSFFLLSSVVWAHGSGSDAFEFQSTATNTGIGLGAALAVVASWSRNNSILWAIFHGILGWIYVIYFAVTR
jgi:hypothetical protein